VTHTQQATAKALQKIIERSSHTSVRNKYAHPDKKLDSLRAEPNGKKARLAAIRAFRKTLGGSLRGLGASQIDELWEKYKYDQFERGLMTRYQLNNWRRV
jgi:hypothetical protein